MMGGHTMLALAALVLLMIAVLNANRVIVSADEEPARNEKYSEAAALAEGLMGEIRTKRFDQLARDSVVATSPSEFSPVFDLGPDFSSEDSCTIPDSLYQSVVRYNDIDDYKGYVRVVATYGSVTPYRLTVDVYYVSETDFSTQSSSQTYLKKIDVLVENPPDIPYPPGLLFSTIQAY